MFLRAAILSLIVVLTLGPPAMAAEASGTAVCEQKVPCPDSPESVAPSDLAAIGNNCVAKSFGYRSLDGIFDEYAGVDSHGCLKAIDSDSKTAWKKPPQCCIARLPDSSCAFKCQMGSR